MPVSGGPRWSVNGSIDASECGVGALRRMLLLLLLQLERRARRGVRVKPPRPNWVGDRGSRPRGRFQRPPASNGPQSACPNAKASRSMGKALTHFVPLGGPLDCKSMTRAGGPAARASHQPTSDAQFAWRPPVPGRTHDARKQQQRASLYHSPSINVDRSQLIQEAHGLGSMARPVDWPRTRGHGSIDRLALLLALASSSPSAPRQHFSQQEATAQALMERC